MTGSSSPDPFAKVRSISGPLTIFLGARAGMRALTYLVFKVTSPPPGEITHEQFESMQRIDASLLGLENLCALVAMIMFLMWSYRVVKGLRERGTTTKYSPGMTAGCWFIPFANFVLPWLAIRDAVARLELDTKIVGAWWILWLLDMPLNGTQQLVRQISMIPDVGALPLESLYQMTGSTFWPYFLIDTAAWGLMLMIVLNVRKAVDKP